MKVTNKDLIQSYIVTTAKYEYTINEKRLLYRIIELLQDYTNGLKLNKKYSINKTIFDDYDVTLPTSAFLNGEKDNNYTRIKDTLLSLNKKIIQYEDGATWGAFNLIERPTISKTNNLISFRVSPYIAYAFLDFSKGYSKYELETALDFNSVYSMRFLELLSTQKHAITYTIEQLKLMFKVENKYKYNRDFITNVIDVAQTEMNEKSTVSFSYKINKKGRAFHSITFYPLVNKETKKRSKEIEKQTSIYFDLDKILINYLKENYLFTLDEIKNNRELFIKAQKHKDFDLLYFLSEQRLNAQLKKNPKGWIINAIKKQLNNG